MRALRATQARPYSLDRIVGVSPAITALRALLQKIAASPASTVLLTGESGTGKDLAAKVLHYASARAARPFMNITCSALPEALLESELFGHERGAFTGADRQKRGLLESADGGTVFLDEIGEMVPALQAKLLRFLEEKTFKRVGGSVDLHVDVRVIAATNRNLQEEVRQGRFREDLFYRLNVLPIVLPPLRERGDDIPRLVHFYIDSYNTEFKKRVRGIDPEAMQYLEAYRVAREHPGAAQRHRAGDAARGRGHARPCRFPGVDVRPPASRRSRRAALGRHRSRAARTLAGRPGARAHRLEPDESGGAAGRESGPDSVPHREVSARKALLRAENVPIPLYPSARRLARSPRSRNPPS